MIKAVRSTLALVVCLAVISTLAFAKSSSKKDVKAKDNQQHHSRLSKVAFWRHGSKDNKSKKTTPTPAASKKAAPKSTAGKSPFSKPTVAKKDQKPQHTASASKTSVHKAPVVQKRKSEPKTDEQKTASVQQ